MKWMREDPRARGLLLAAAAGAAVVVCAAVRTDGARGQGARGEDPPAKAAVARRVMLVKQVEHAFGGEADIYLTAEDLKARTPSPARAKVRSVKQAAGVIFLYVRTDKGHMLVNPRHVVAAEVTAKRYRPRR